MPGPKAAKQANGTISLSQSLLTNFAIFNQCCHLQKSNHTEEEKEKDLRVVENYVTMCNALACMYVDTEQFDKGEKLHQEVLELKEK